MKGYTCLEILSVNLQKQVCLNSDLFDYYVCFKKTQKRKPYNWNYIPLQKLIINTIHENMHHGKSLSIRIFKHRPYNVFRVDQEGLFLLWIP